MMWISGWEPSLLEEGGLMMWPLLLVSLFGFVIFMERTLFLHRGQIRTNDFLAGIKNLLRKQRLVEALTVCEETPGPVPGVVKAALLHHNEGEDEMRRAIQAAALVEIPSLERRIGSIAAIARIAPLLGLLGTIIGMIHSFHQLQIAGTYAHFGSLAGGLGEALVTTAVGIAIAIIALISHHFLQGRTRALVHDMEFAGHDILQFLLRDLPKIDAETPEDTGKPSQDTALSSEPTTSRS